MLMSDTEDEVAIEEGEHVPTQLDEGPGEVHGEGEIDLTVADSPDEMAR